jgi:hypothetical protein
MTDLSVIPVACLERYQRRFSLLGAGGIALMIVGAFVNPAQFFRSYLLGYVFWTGLALGSLGILMLNHLTGGGWGLGTRRSLEAATRTFPLLAVLFFPLAYGRHYLYVWTRLDVVAHSEILQHKSPYLNWPFFLVRTFFYFVIWILISYFLNRWSLAQDRFDDRRPTEHLRRLSGPGILVLAVTVTFACVDWVMSLDPEWYSTLFGLIFLEGQGLTSLAFIIAVTVALSQREPLSQILTPTQFHDLGKLMLAFVLIWAYLSFSQFLIVWSGNLPEEIPWYIRRLQGGWQWLGLGLIIFHFALPFLLLLSRDLKRNSGTLAKVAWIVVVMRFVDLYWLTGPELHDGRLQVHWLDLAAPLGIGGLWLALFFNQLRSRPLLPIGNPELKMALAQAGK